MTTIVNLGGTIALAYSGERPRTMRTKDFVRGADFELIDIDPTQSFNLTWNHLLKLRRALLQRMSGGSGKFAILTGTDTAEEVAYFLHVARPRAARVILVVAMHTPDKYQKRPLGLARALEWLEFSDRPEVGLCWDGNLVTGPHFTKHYRKGWGFRKIPRDRSLRPFCVDDSALLTRPMPVVPLLTISLGCADYVESILRSSRFEGVVVECYANGDLPRTLAIALKGLVRSGKPIVIASRSRPGLIHAAYPGLVGSSQDLLACGVLGAGQLDGARARLRLAVAMAARPLVPHASAFLATRE